MESLTLTLIKKIKLKPGQAITILIIVILLGITDTNLYPLLKNMIRPDVIALDKLIHTYVQLELIFPLLIGVGFILIYFKYYIRSKTPEV